MNIRPNVNVNPQPTTPKPDVPPAPPVARMLASGERAPLTHEERISNLERQVASIVRAGAANIMAARGADKAPGAALPSPEKPVDPLAGIPDAATAPEVRYVVCAAMRGHKHGDIRARLVIGARHGDRTMHDAIAASIYNLDEYSFEQGFIDQYGVFMTRTEAWQVALSAGQIRYRCGGDTANGGTLYSENLY